MSPTESLWPRLAALPLVVESCEYDRLHYLSVPPKAQVDPRGFDDLHPEAPAYFAQMAAWLARQGFTR